MATQRYHHGDLRAVLLDEAERSIAHRGVDALSLRQLARDVGVSHGAPARHFRDKQALLDALALHGFEELNRRMVAAATGPGELMARFRAVARAYLGFAVEHPELLDVMYSTKHHPDASEKLKTVAHESMTATEALLGEAIAAGVITDAPPAILARVAFASVHGLAMLATGDLLDGVAIEDLLDATVDTLLRGFT
ncbi:TetR family transcriptional regulator [Rhodococcus sp. 06-418-5]|uniref:TetR/AcrR family transcriptional regulator n=1 Tax=unclassified Rhodococcus (in: high G+C Gram-positive bacteria) TaxID=192944 RepID=UPI000B9B2257|nr:MULTISPECIES: TetR/AcrR family transcriptional regulator [unclassified Rhodococcus (in: high G+C Gram-positive bacteria)]OZC72982.1 TetR family transcriptional regulator [Rhodococcus sp. 06-418-5]OZE15470.1 TetR family transcriptional regulator [Rhodococcus sp. 05-2255-3B1]OZE16307.1 TetR family transcriptional regulator [Rhodococcus sp. 05-2255-3C]OZE21192.1 TetR family transcriptional regulator [Rhodococcus sp. 05-2255-2A2]